MNENTGTNIMNNPGPWAKTSPYESISSHSEKVYMAMDELCKTSPSIVNTIAAAFGISKEEAIYLCKYIAGVHDIGKIVPIWQFQESIPKESSDWYASHGFSRSDQEDIRKNYEGMTYRHERGGFLILQRIWKEDGLFSRKVRKSLAEAVLVHHQKCGSGYADKVDGTVFFKDDIWKKEQEKLERRYRKKCSIENLVLKEDNMDIACTCISGMLMRADWLESSLSWVVYGYEDILKKTIEETGLVMKGKIPEPFEEMWPEIKYPRPLQEKAIEIMSKEIPRFALIEDMCGAGKTEAALYMANILMHRCGKDGIYVALPTSATANQMHERVDDLLRKFDLEGARLLHGSAWLMKDEFQDISRFMSQSKLGLFAPMGVGTIDQALTSVLRSKYSNLKMTALLGKIIIIDEVHAYDAYISQEITRLLTWCKAANASVIMLSATLPRKKKEEFMAIFSDDEPVMKDYPRITTIDINSHMKEHKVAGTAKELKYKVKRKPILNNNEEIVRLAMETVQDGGILCLNVNNIKKATELTEILDRKTIDAGIHLFHARYTEERRAEIEKECVDLFGKKSENRPHKAILVATQVVEQSIDLDFDYIITEPCPIDLLIQRLGREYRHEREWRPHKDPLVYILTPTDEEMKNEYPYGASEFVYPRYLLDRTLEILPDTINVPQDVTTLVENVYDDINEEELRQSYLDMMAKNHEYKGAAVNATLEPPKSYFQFGKHMFDLSISQDEEKTRLSEPSERLAVLPHRLYDKLFDGTATYNEQKEAYKYSFSIQRRKVEELLDKKGCGMMSDVYIFKGDQEEFLSTETHSTNGIFVNRRYGVQITERK